MKIDVLITAQYYEKRGEENWKAKGVTHFTVKAETFWLSYSEDEDIKERFSDLISDQNSSHERFEYVDYEILWNGIIEIDGTIE